MALMVQVHQMLRRRIPCNGSSRPISLSANIQRSQVRSHNQSSIYPPIAKYIFECDTVLQPLDYEITTEKGGHGNY
jgi:hypothetical protein